MQMIKRIKYSRTRHTITAITVDGEEVTMKLDLCPGYPIEYAIVKNLAKFERVLKDEFPGDPFYVEHVLTNGGAVSIMSTALYYITERSNQPTPSTTKGENKGCRKAT